MLFHYGNCKNELFVLKQLNSQHCKKINDLDRQVVTLLGQVQEGKAMYDYQVALLEREISALKSELGARKCVCETMEKEIASLNEIVSKKDDELKSLRAVADKKETAEPSRQKKGKK